jgi:hypothetical protein
VEIDFADEANRFCLIIKEKRGNSVPSLRYTSRICVISKICGNPRPNRSKICVICEICVTFSQKIEQV